MGAQEDAVLWCKALFGRQGVEVLDRGDLAMPERAFSLSVRSSNHQCTIRLLQNSGSKEFVALFHPLGCQRDDLLLYYFEQSSEQCFRYVS